MDLASIVSTMEDSGIENAARLFHTRMWESTGNIVLVRILDQLTTPLFAFCRVDGEGSADCRARYRRMLDGLRSANSQSSVEALREQIDTIQRHASSATAEAEGREATAGV